MNSGVLARLLLGFIFIIALGCSKQNREVEQNLSTLPPVDTPEATPANREDAAPTGAAKSSDTPLLLPTTFPVTTVSGWRILGNEKTGLQLTVPPDWVNLTGAIDTAVATNQLGLIVLLTADSEQTGSNLLGGKPLESGAYAAGLISRLDLPPNTPQTALTRLITELNLTLANGAPPVPVTIINAAGGQIPGAYVDLIGSPLPFSQSNATELRTRLYLFTSALGGAVGQQTQALFLLTAPAASWEQYAAEFAQMADSLIIHNIYNNYVLSDGSANVVGSLGEQDMVNGRLEADVKDVWTFRLEEPRYATISITPEDKALDFTWTLYSPTGQTIAAVDNGYAGDAEVMTDQLLTDTGLYVIEIGEFFNASGGYTMSLTLAREPLFGGGGEIQIGQTLESTLAPKAVHNWIFTGSAGELLTAVLTPQDQFDAVLELYGPDGRQLINLDEGYSGDAELFSGVELPLTGQYTLVVSSFAGNGGRYALSLDVGGDNTANFYDAGDLAYGERQQETFQPYEAHVWFFTGQAGDNIAVQVTPLDDNLDLDVWLLDAEANRLAAQDAAQSGGAETVTFTLAQDGQYLVFIREVFGNAGPYEVVLEIGD
ncbi:MAG: hypothetical protein HF973_01255 [Chloroflexi bacterium]|nr:hypothetical protein [Chloroflexota bacterium]